LGQQAGGNRECDLEENGVSSSRAAAWRVIGRGPCRKKPKRFKKITLGSWGDFRRIEREGDYSEEEV